MEGLLENIDFFLRTNLRMLIIVLYAVIKEVLQLQVEFIKQKE
tara:strand:- start:89 stop:217 length:129 start_codon:yes stop_codon:yes gene_type:complete